MVKLTIEKCGFRTILNPILARIPCIQWEARGLVVGTGRQTCIHPYMKTDFDKTLELGTRNGKIKSLSEKAIIRQESRRHFCLFINKVNTMV